MTAVFVKDPQRDRRGEGNVTPGAETGVMQPGAQECLQLGEARKGTSLELSEGAQPCQHRDLSPRSSDFGFPELKF